MSPPLLRAPTPTPGVGKSAPRAGGRGSAGHRDGPPVDPTQRGARLSESPDDPPVDVVHCGFSVLTGSGGSTETHLMGSNTETSLGP